MKLIVNSKQESIEARNVLIRIMNEIHTKASIHPISAYEMTKLLARIRDNIEVADRADNRTGGLDDEITK